jgi:hypothetical protein
MPLCLSNKYGLHRPNNKALRILYVFTFATCFGHYQVDLQKHKNTECSLGTGRPFTNSEYSILVTWIFFQIVK